MENILYRKKRKQRCQNRKSIHNIGNGAIIQIVNCYQRNDWAYCTDNNSLDDKWWTDKEIRCADIFHNSNLFLTDRNTNHNGIGNQENGHRQQNYDDSDGNIGNQRIHACQRISCYFWFIYLTDPVNSFQKSYQFCLSGNIIKINLIVLGIL